MTEFELEQLLDLIEIIEKQKPYNLSLELHPDDDGKWHCDILVGGKSTIGCMLEYLPDHESCETFLYRYNPP